MHALVLEELRRHVVRGSVLLAFRLLLELDEVDELAAEPEVAKLEYAVFIDQNIGRSRRER